MLKWMKWSKKLDFRFGLKFFIFCTHNMTKKTLFIMVMSGMINQEAQKPQNESFSC